MPDQEGGQWLLAEANEELTRAFPRLQHLWAATAYHDRFVAWVQQTLGWTVDVVKRPARWYGLLADQEPPEVPRGFQVLPRPAGSSSGRSAGWGAGAGPAKTTNICRPPPSASSISR